MVNKMKKEEAIKKIKRWLEFDENVYKHCYARILPFETRIKYEKALESLENKV